MILFAPNVKMLNAHFVMKVLWMRMENVKNQKHKFKIVYHTKMKPNANSANGDIMWTHRVSVLRWISKTVWLFRHKIPWSVKFVMMEFSLKMEDVIHQINVTLMIVITAIPNEHASTAREILSCICKAITLSVRKKPIN